MATGKGGGKAPAPQHVAAAKAALDTAGIFADPIASLPVKAAPTKADHQGRALEALSKSGVVANPTPNADTGIKDFGASNVNTKGVNTKSGKKVAPSAKDLKAADSKRAAMSTPAAKAAQAKKDWENGAANRLRYSKDAGNVGSWISLGGKKAETQMSGFPGASIAKGALHITAGAASDLTSWEAPLIHEALNGGKYGVPKAAYDLGKNVVTSTINEYEKLGTHPLNVAKDFYNHPLATTGALLGPVGLLTRGGVRAGLVEKPSSIRTVKIPGAPDESAIHLPASRDPLVAHAQHKFDQFSSGEGTGPLSRLVRHLGDPHMEGPLSALMHKINVETPADLPVIGSKGRVGREMAYKRAVQEDLQKLDNVPLDRAINKLNKSVRFNKGDRAGLHTAAEAGIRYGESHPEEMVLNGVDTFHHTREMVKREIVLREDTLKGNITPRLRRNTEARIIALKKSLDHLENPSPELIEVIRKGRHVMNAIEGDKISRGLISRDTAEARKALPSRLVSGAKFYHEGEAANTLRYIAQQQREVSKRLTDTKNRLERAAKGSSDVKNLEKQLDSHTRTAVKASLKSVALRSALDEAAGLSKSLRAEERQLNRMHDYPQEFTPAKIAKQQKRLENLQARFGRAQRKVDQHFEAEQTKLKAVEDSAKTDAQRQLALKKQEALLEHYHSTINDLSHTSEKLGAMRHLVEGKSGTFIGAEDVTAGHNAAFYPDIKNSKRNRYVGGQGSLKNPSEVIHQNEGVLFTQARAKTGLEPVQLSAQRSTVSKVMKWAVNEAAKHEKPLPANLEPDRGWMYFNKDGFKMPKETREQPLIDELLATGEINHAMVKDYEAMRDQMTPMDKKAAREAIASGHRVTQIPEEVGHNLVRSSIQLVGHEKVVKWTKRLLKPFDLVNQAVSLAYIYVLPKFVVVNAASDVGMLLVQQHLNPYLVSKNIIAAATAHHEFPIEIVNYLDSRVGEGPIAGLAIEDTAISKVTSATAHQMNKMASTWTRRSSILYELGHEGFKTPAEISEFVGRVMNHDEEAMAHMDIIARRAEDAVGNYRHMPPWARQTFGRLIFVFGWVYASSRYMLQVGQNHPYLSDTLMQYGQSPEADHYRNTQGPLTSWMNEMSPVSAVSKQFGVNTEKWVKPGAITPIGSFQDIVKSVAQGFGGNVEGAKPAGQYGNFAIQLAVAIGYHMNPSTGMKYPNNYGPTDIMTDILFKNAPPVKLVQGLISPDVRTRDFRDTSVANQPYSMPFKSATEGRLHALEHGLFGAFIPETYNMDKIHYLAQKEHAGTLNPEDRVIYQTQNNIAKYNQQMKQIGSQFSADQFKQLAVAGYVNYLHSVNQSNHGGKFDDARNMYILTVVLGSKTLQDANDSMTSSNLGQKPITPDEVKAMKDDLHGFVTKVVSQKAP